MFSEKCRPGRFRSPLPDRAASAFCRPEKLRVVFVEFMPSPRRLTASSSSQLGLVSQRASHESIFVVCEPWPTRAGHTVNSHQAVWFFAAKCFAQCLLARHLITFQFSFSSSNELLSSFPPPTLSLSHRAVSHRVLCLYFTLCYQSFSAPDVSLGHGFYATAQYILKGLVISVLLWPGFGVPVVPGV